jgi:mannose-1-phosphate guanylyltransferase / mannose-6-phosphate isomerase
MTTLNVYPILLSGGKGTRLWPLSSSNYPKQYQTFIGKESLFEQTFLRLKTMDLQKNLTIVTGKDQAFLCQDKLKNHLNADLLIEPTGKNTAPAIAAAALHIKDKSTQKNPAILILPTDHHLENTQEFYNSLQLAYQNSLQGSLVTFGVKPNEPHCGYGYIKKGESLTTKSWKIDKFTEKPQLELAKKLSCDPDYFWNSGMFLFQCDSILQELETHSPELFLQTKNSYTKATKKDNCYYLDSKAFSQIKPDSIDYAVLEKSQNAAVVSLNAKWSDLGNWKAVSSAQTKDKNNNFSKGQVFTTDTSNCYINSDKKITAVLGVKDLVVVSCEDSLLISHKNSCEKIKSIVTHIENNKDLQELLVPTTVRRPWGSYTDLHKDKKCRVKKITVNPGEKLSLQLHNHRSEHWVIVKGTAQVTCGETVSSLEANNSIFIPLKTKHRLENLTSSPIEIIETQTGDYLEEDDIVRFADIYGR